MQLARPVCATHPLRFGRGPARTLAAAPAASGSAAEDLKLFATTFAAGFVFVSVFLA
ncbi:MAG TPA: hypothetical protein VM308_07365 [Sphingomicrobium sp.]|nr:hypothetical protein [Sphingomicrobium sp.]